MMMKRGMRRWLGGLVAVTMAGALLLPAGGIVRAERRPHQEHSVVVFQIGSYVYTVDDQEYKMDVAPRIDEKSGRTLLPVRYVADSMNADTYWNGEGQRITLVHREKNRVVELAVGESGMRVSDSEEEYYDQELDQRPIIDPSNRTMLPVRAVAEALYGEVSYDPATQKITIIRPRTAPETREPGPALLDFGSILPKEHHKEGMDRHPEYMRTVTIKNRGEGPLYIDSFGIEGNAFSLCGVQYEPFTLEPGQYRSLQVCAEAQEPGDYEGVMWFKSRVKFRTDLLLERINLLVRILGCRVSISGGGQRPNINTDGITPLGPAGVDAPVVNVGQHIILQANPTGLFGPYTYQWTVNGAHIKDYQELASAPWSTTPMGPADYQAQTISYYWKQTGLHTVTVKATNRLGRTCTASRTYTVERNNANVNRQAEDFYTWNHTSAVLVEHQNWHSANMYNPCTAVGTAFWSWHRRYLQRFQSWRAEFGYPAYAVWDPGTPLPGGIANAHAARAGFYNPAANVIPSYLTAAGGAAASPCWAGAFKKADFPSVNAYWIQVEGPWHNGVHVAIGGWGGDMRFTSRAPKDPIFWRFHRYIDGL